MTNVSTHIRPRKVVSKKTSAPTTHPSGRPYKVAVKWVTAHSAWVNPTGGAHWNGNNFSVSNSDPMTGSDGFININTYIPSDGDVVNLGTRPTRHSFLCALRAWERKQA